ncbi:MAG: DUF4166 domain-containing protein [Terricaulis sp.]
MKRVLVVGGAGVFGSRLARGLRETTDAYVILAGRSKARAEAARRETGAHEAVALDREQATAAQLGAIGPDLVIDAAGPFQGADLSFARAVIEAGAHYLDLADARDFVAAFPSLDALARERGVFALTGASSTPALTHAVLDELCRGWRRVDVVRAGIAPANKMDRGPSVMRAILSWVGAPVRVFENGEWRTRGGWSDCGIIDVPQLGRRRFALVETPDLDLIPSRYTTRDTAWFMAALELPLMQRGMECVGALRRWGIIGSALPFAEILRRAGNWLLPFGSDCGGMIVEALGRDAQDRPRYARWSMFAPNGEGPYTPTFAALATARKYVAGAAIPAGAGACVGLLRLEDFSADFSRHAFTTEIESSLMLAPFDVAAGDTMDTLPMAIREAHRGGPVTRLRGRASVRGASSPIAALVARVFGMPKAASDVPVEVTMRLWPDREEWRRSFGSRHMRSTLEYVAPGIVRESFGPFNFDMRLDATATSLSMKVVGWRLGPLPMPGFLAPRSDAVESQDPQGRFRFDVPIELPLIGRLVHYSGWLDAEEVEAAPAAPEREAV